VAGAAVYAVNKMISMKTPATQCHDLKKKLNLKIKGDGPISYHLGLKYVIENDVLLRQQPLQ
jgi:hypothetical protein